MKQQQTHLKSALITGLAYGLGFVIGVLLISLVFNSGVLDSIADLFAGQHLVIGLVLLFLVVSAGGGAAGAVGGWGLSRALVHDHPKRVIARSAVGFGFGFGIVLLPITGVLAALAMYNGGSASFAGFILSIGLIGALFGFISGLMTATLPGRLNYWRITGVLTLAFGLGGLAFGAGLWVYFFPLYETNAGTASLLLAFFIFGAVGGGVMGWIFSRTSEQAPLAGEGGEAETGNIFYRVGQWFKNTRFYQKRGFWGTVIFLCVLFLISRLVAISPLNFSEADLEEQLPLDSVGVHWSTPWTAAETRSRVAFPAVAQSGGLLVVAWGAEDGLFYTTSTVEQDGLRKWDSVMSLSDTAHAPGAAPQVVVDSAGQIHFVWVEGDAAGSGPAHILYRMCGAEGCGETIALTDQVTGVCSTDQNSAPALAVNRSDTLLAVWDSGDQLAYVQWQGDGVSVMSQGCALQNWQGRVEGPRLAAGINGSFALAFAGDDEIFIAESEDGTAFTVISQEAGQTPEVFADSRGAVHAAWCGLDGQVRYRGARSQTGMLPGSYCANRPVLGQDGSGQLHLIWLGAQVEQPSGARIETPVIYESRLVSGSWTSPIIVELAAAEIQPAVTAGDDGRLHLVWDGSAVESGQLQYAYYQNYECSETALNTQGQRALEVARSGDYRPTDDLVPYCQNQFDSLLVLPIERPEYSDNPPSVNGAFDDVADLVQTARYEVLLSTMWYETDDTGTSPGVVLAQGVKALYDQVKAHPEYYPRGMTVRILLDNPPELTFSNLISQLWSVFNHMRYAGVPTLSDPEIGWNLEIANFDGSWPHGHTKMVVVDGKTAIAAGFNYQHKHQSKDHPSGQGNDDFDLGLQMSGPVAQTTQLAFDDLWSGSHQLVCPDLDSDSPLWWLSCRRETAVADHVPEVKKLYLAEEDHNAFALHRTAKFNESDIIVPAAVASAEETLDVVQVNFTLEMICDLNVLFEICDFREALSYMEAMMEAIETNEVKTRVLIKQGPIEAIESNIAVDAFREALEARGLSHLVEFRYFQDSVHAKSVLIDNQFLIVGSQNFHYSAYGEGALTEFNIGTDDPDAVAAFQKFFNYHWDQGVPIPVE